MSDTTTPSPSRGRLAALGAYGFEMQEPVILAALTSGEASTRLARTPAEWDDSWISRHNALKLAHHRG